MRFAVALDGSEVAQHFGHCEQFLIVTAEAGKVIAQETVANPGHRPGVLPRFLKDQQVHCIIAGGMGTRAQQLFQQYDIETLTGVSGAAEQIVQDFLQEKLEIGPNQCHH